MALPHLSAFTTLTRSWVSVVKGNQGEGGPSCQNQDVKHGPKAFDVEAAENAHKKVTEIASPATEVRHKSRRKDSDIRILSQNVRGLKDLKTDGSNPKLDEVVKHLHDSGTYACCLQETWCTGGGKWEVDGYLFLQHGLETSTCNRGRLGLAIGLSKDAQQAFVKAGSQKLVFGDRIMAARLAMPAGKHCRRVKGKKVMCDRIHNVFLVNAYAPVSRASVEERKSFYSCLERCLAECKPHEILVMGGDVNASMGTRRDVGVQTLGSFGETHVNAAGTELYDFCTLHGLSVSSTYFKKAHTHATWYHPFSKKGYQLDHFFVKLKDHKRVTDVRNCPTWGVHSDHTPLLITLRLAGVSSKRRNVLDCQRVDRRLLRNEEKRTEFRQIVLDSCLQQRADAEVQHLTPMAHLQTALASASHVLKAPKDSSPQWFRDAEDLLAPLIKGRQNAQEAYQVNPSKEQHAVFAAARRSLRKQVLKAKAGWQMQRFAGISDFRSPGTYWKEISLLKNGFRSWHVSTALPSFRDADGKIAANVTESAALIKKHVEKVCNIPAHTDENMLSKVRQRSEKPEAGALPDDEEIIKFTRASKNDKGTGESGIAAEMVKTLLGEENVFALWRESIHCVWTSAEVPEDWLLSRLKLLYKNKGDRRVLDNWRGVSLMEAAAKIVSAIIASRLTAILVAEGLEEQNGFMPKRGCADGLFSLKLALQKRKEHSLDSWAVFIDLVKAFDSVPRSALLSMLSRFGVPDSLRKLIAVLHTDVVIVVDAGGVDVRVNSTVGVKQGDSLAPILFDLYFQACMEVLDQEWSVEKPSFRWAQDDVINGRRYNSRGIDFLFNRSLYADDGAFLFASRKDMQDSLHVIFRVLRAFGLTMHVGRDGKSAKSEGMFFPWKRGNTAYSDADTSDLSVDGGTVSFCLQFPYLGALVTWNLDDRAEIADRITKATKAFGALSGPVFRQQGIDRKAKKAAYTALVLNILLYGCETWILTAKTRYDLRCFHRRCMRIMMDTSCWAMICRGDQHVHLQKRLGLDDISAYIIRRRLQWAGHVYRMPAARLPRQLLTAWVPHKRPIGRPSKTYGHCLHQDLQELGVKCA